MMKKRTFGRFLLYFFMFRKLSFLQKMIKIVTATYSLDWSQKPCTSFTLSRRDWV